MKKVIPVVVLSGEAEANRALASLIEGGLPIAEITLRTPYAEEAIALAAKKFSDLSLGAGSVLCAEQARRVIGLGAKFVVSPGLSEEIAAVCAAEKIPYLPGAVTPTELMRARALGFSTVKFFPAEVFGGLAAVKALSAPFPEMRFVPTGGVTLRNLKEFLACDAVAAVGGSFMMRGDVVDNCKKIGEICREVAHVG